MVVCPIRLQERCEIFIARVSANGSRPELDQRVLYAATGAIQRLGYSTMKPEQLQVMSGIVSGRDAFAVLLTDFKQEPVLRVPADSVRPGVAGRRDINSLCCRSFDGYYERSGKCREPSHVLAATSEA